jgi:hypothetical protein
MVLYLNTVVALLAVKVVAAAAGNALNRGATGTQLGVQVTELPTPPRPGPGQGVAGGPHPPFTFPPSGPPTTFPTCRKVQYDFPSGTNSDTSRADAVRDLYQRSWNQYATYCFGHDQLLTLTNTCADDLFGWGATIVDGIDTAIVMNLTDIVAQQLAFIAQVDFRYGQPFQTMSTVGFKPDMRPKHRQFFSRWL